MTNSTEARLALLGGTPVRLAPLPLEVPATPANDLEPARSLEHELAAFLGGERVAVLCRGRATALGLALRLIASELAPERLEIALPDIGGEPIARAAIDAGLRVLPIDVDQDSGNLSARSLAASAGPHTGAMALAHLFGHPATMPDLLRLAEHHGLAVLEDLTDSLGAAYADVPVGAFGAVAALGGGEGRLLSSTEFGAVLVADGPTAARVREWRDELGGEPPEAVLRLTLAELRNASEVLHARQQAAWHLTYELRGVRGVSAMAHGRRIRHSYSRYVIRLRSVLWERSAAETAELLTAEGIPAAVAVERLLHEDMDVRAQLGEDDQRLAEERFGIARGLASALIALPLNSAMTSTDMNDVADAVRKVAQTSERGEALTRTR